MKISFVFIDGSERAKYRRSRMLEYNIVYSSQTDSFYNCMKFKRNLLHCNANIHFEKTCLGMKNVGS
jgi:hypothetical protein